MINEIKYAVIWGMLLVLLDYPLLFTVTIHICLGVLYKEYQGLFKKICESVTGEQERIYVTYLSSSFVPYLLIQGMLFSGSFEAYNHERFLCSSLLLSTVIVSILRIQQYSTLCIQASDEKRKKKKYPKPDEDW